MTEKNDLRLPGSVAEVMASPAGPKVGAFFDLDGTLVAGFTGVILTRERFRSRDMGVGRVDHHDRRRAQPPVRPAWNSRADQPRPREALARPGAVAICSRSVSGCSAEKIEKRIYPEMRDLVHAHLERGHTVVLSSSALTIQVEPVASFLGIPNMLTNRFEVDDDGVLTGKVVKPILWGPGKANAVQKFAAEHDIDLADSYFYADGNEDVALMYLVGNPRPTNPGDKMAEVARKRGWPILEFNSRGRGGLVGQVRTLIGVGSSFPAAYGAIGWGLLTRSRRRGVNFFTTAFPQLLLAVNGVRPERAGRGEPQEEAAGGVHLQPPQQLRPDHLAALIKDNWTGVGKKELQNDPVSGRWASWSTPCSSTATTRSRRSSRCSRPRISPRRACRW